MIASSQTMYRVDITTGEVVSSFECFISINKNYHLWYDPWGLTYDGSSLWVVDNISHKIYQLDKSGNILCEYTAPCSNLNGLTFDISIKSM